MIRFAQKGMTLIEITVVLLILIALAGLTIPYIGGTTRKALCDATDVSMANIKRTIMERYSLDTLGNFPVSKTGSTINSDFSLHYLFAPGGWPTFDPDTQVGWRGPYVQNGIILNAADEGALDGSFKDVSSPFDAATDHIHLNLADTQTVILDAWGRPIIIQVRDEADCSDWGLPTDQGQCARLVSAGPGSGISLANGALNTVISETRKGDDRIIYLQNTPAGEQNESCSN